MPNPNPILDAKRENVVKSKGMLIKQSAALSLKIHVLSRVCGIEQPKDYSLVFEPTRFPLTSVNRRPILKVLKTECPHVTTGGICSDADYFGDELVSPHYPRKKKHPLYINTRNPIPEKTMKDP